MCFLDPQGKLGIQWEEILRRRSLLIQSVLPDSIYYVLIQSYAEICHAIIGFDKRLDL